MEFEFQILDFLQTLHNPVGDALMKGASFLGNGGILWIVLTIVLLCIHGSCSVRGCSAVQCGSEADDRKNPAF